MFDFEPTDEQQMLIDWIKRFAVSDLRQTAHDAEETGDFPRSLLEKGWELGILQAAIPEKYGGFGDRSVVTGILAFEEMAYGDVAGTLALMAPGLFAIPVLLAGNEGQKEAWLPALVEGSWTPYTSALIEPSFDFDPNTLKTTAARDGDEFCLTGEKTFVPFAMEAKTLLVYANLEGRTQGFVVPAESPGITVGERNKLLGVNALPAYQVSLDDVRVPMENQLGYPSGHEFAPILEASWVAMAAISVGLSRAAFDYARDYAKDREAFGVKIAQKQAIAFMLAEMATEIEAARLLVWEAAWMLDNGKPEGSKHAYLAHSCAADLAMMVTDRAVQVLGGHGYIREHPVEHWMRNGRGIAALTGLVIV